MKITDIRTIVVGNPWKNWVFVVVETSDGISGLGEATGGLSTMPNKEAVEEIKHLAIGKNPLEISNIVDELYKALFLKMTPTPRLGPPWRPRDPRQAPPGHPGHCRQGGRRGGVAATAC